MVFKLGFTNVEQPDSDAQVKSTILTLAGMSDVVTYNEAAEASSHKVIESLSGFDCYIYGENAIAWRTEKFDLIYKGHKVVMFGGFHGAGKDPNDKRNRGPNRNVAGVKLREKATGHEFWVWTHHAVHQAFTSNPWRLPFWKGGFKNLFTEVSRHPGDSILTGDMNATNQVKLPMAGWHEVATPATYGSQRYDRILYRGDVAITGVKTVKTNSDHKGLTATVTLSVVVDPGIEGQSLVARGIALMKKSRDPSIRARAAVIEGVARTD